MADNDYFIAASECHLMGDLSEVSYYPDVARWYRSAMKGVARVWGAPRTPAPMRASELIKQMDEAGVDVGFGLRESMMDVTGYAAPMSTNAFIIREIAPYPDRLYLECNVGPILKRGVKHAIWELEYLVKEQNAKLCKVYACEDGPLNDPEMWPFYEKACELDVPLTVHTGMAYVVPQPTKYTLPILLDDVLLAFPDLKVIAYHMGWPYQEELFGLAGKHRNLYVGISGIVGWFTRAPYRGYHLIGEALEWAGPDKVLFGLDWPGVDLKACVDYMRTFDIPEELQRDWGYPAITDETRAKILGLNLAKLAGIEPTKRVPAPSSEAKVSGG
ncbi:MAG: amidohydrolase family protein [Dehalococcoidia bacterium]